MNLSTFSTINMDRYSSTKLNQLLQEKLTHFLLQEVQFRTMTTYSSNTDLRLIKQFSRHSKTLHLQIVRVKKQLQYI